MPASYALPMVLLSFAIAAVGIVRAGAAAGMVGVAVRAVFAYNAC